MTHWVVVPKVTLCTEQVQLVQNALENSLLVVYGVSFGAAIAAEPECEGCICHPHAVMTTSASLTASTTPMARVTIMTHTKRQY